MNSSLTTRRKMLATAASSVVAPSLLTSAVTAAQRKRVLRFAHLCDIHLQPEQDAANGLAQCLKHLQSLPDKPSLVFTGGDIIMDAWEADYARTDLQWKLFRNVMAAECSLPVEHCLGNHDVWSFKSREGNKDHEAKSVKKWALDVLGLTSPYRSFDRAGWHFIVLDSVYPKDPQYIGKLDEEQFEWLTEDLGKTPETMPVLVVSHIPILSICAHFFQEMTQDDNWVVPGGLMHIDARRIRDLFKSYKNVKAAIAGHIHLVDRLDYLGVTYLGNGAVSGAWWSGDWHETPAGYALMDLFDDGTVERTYMPYGWQVKAT